MTIASLPNLLIAGVKKAGTSSLFDYLAQHPDVCPSDRKELGFFSPLADGGDLPALEEYARHFGGCGSQRYRMEATPTYYYGGGAVVSAVADVLVDPHIVITLRDPVARLWSHWRMKDRSGTSAIGSQSFDDYVERCALLEADGRQWLPENKGYAALTQGRYVDYITTWLDAFGDNVKVLFFEQWASAPHDMMRSLCRWLEIDEDAADSIDFEARNRGTSFKSPAVARAASAVNRVAGRLFQRNPKMKASLRTLHDTLNKSTQREEMNPSTQRRLEELYRSSNRRLSDELQARGYRDLPLWASESSLPAETETRRA